MSDLRPELAELFEAYSILDKKQTELASGPMTPYRFVLHAKEYINRLIEAEVRGGAA